MPPHTPITEEPSTQRAPVASNPPITQSAAYPVARSAPVQAPSTGASQADTVALAGPAIPYQRYRINVARLDIGMYVAELDRPWIDTPFLLHGFLIDNPAELATLRRYCRYAMVNPELSDPRSSQAIREAELLSTLDERDEQAEQAEEAQRNRPTGVRALRLRSDLKVNNGTRERFRDLIRSTSGLDEDPQAAHESNWRRIAQRIGGLIGASSRGASATAQSSRMAARALRQEIELMLLGELPPDTRLTRYPPQIPVAEELPRARRVVDHAERVVNVLGANVREGVPSPLNEVQVAVRDMIESLLANPDALMWVSRLRSDDSSVGLHGVRVALYMLSLGRHLGLPTEQLTHLGMIGMLADIGKCRLPRALLDKPGMLNPAEYSIVKEHVRMGIEALGGKDALPHEVYRGIAQHHERLDGSGYPKGLVGDTIGLHGKIAGIADCFAALTSARSYANAQAPQDALMNMYHWAGVWFNETLVEQFVESIGAFPVGSLVELGSGEIALVVAQNRLRRLEPLVLVLTGTDKRPLESPVERDLLADRAQLEGTRRRIVRGLPIGAYGLPARDFYLTDKVVMRPS